MAGWQDAPLADASGQSWKDAPLEEPRSALSDIAWQAPQGFNRGMDAMINLPYNVLMRWPAKLAGYDLPEGRYFQRFNSEVPPETTAGKFAGATGEAIGSAMLPEMAFASKAEQLAKLGSKLPRATVEAAPRVADEAEKGVNLPVDASRVGAQSVGPTTTMRNLGQQIGEAYTETPKKALTVGNVAAGTGGIGSEAAREAELGPGWEIAAAAGTPVAAIGAPVTAFRAARGLLRIPPETLSPTLARWKASNADGIWRKLGISLSADGATPAAETPGGQAAAYMMLANQLRRANVSPDQLDTLLNRIAEARRFYSNSYAPDAVALVDLDPALQRFAGSVMRENPGVWKRAVDFMYARQTGLTPTRGELPPNAGVPSREMMAPPIKGKEAEKLYGTTFGTPQESIVPMGQRERVGDAFKRALNIEDIDFHGHAPTAEMTDAQIEALAGEEARNLYGAARQAGQGVDLRPTLNPILDRWETAIADQPGPVRAQLAKHIREVRQAIEPRSPVQPGVPVRGTASPFERFDNWKKYLDADLAKYYGSDKTQNKVTGNALQQFKRELLDGVKDENETIILPGMDSIQDNGLGAAYANARGAFSSAAASRRALDLGYKIWKGEAGIDDFKALDGDIASQKLVRAGMVGGYEADTKNMAPSHDVTKLFDKPRLQEVLSEIVPRSKGNGEFSDRPERFGRYLGYEQLMQGTPKRTYQGSPTAERLADDRNANELFALADQLRKGGAKQVMANFAANTLTKWFGYRADTATTLGRVLFTAEPTQRAEAVRQIRQIMNSEQFTYFQRLMRDQAQRVMQAGVAATPGAASEAGNP